MIDTPLPFPSLFQHFWLLHGIFWLVGTRTFPLNAPRSGGNPEASAALSKRLGFLVLGVSVVLWAIQQSAGPAPTPFLFAWPAPWKWLALGVAVLVWLASAGWVYLGTGARTLAEAFGVTPQTVKAFVAPALSVSSMAALVAFTFGNVLLDGFLREFSASSSLQQR